MMSQDEKDEIVRRMKAGERVCDIARTMGRHQSTVSNFVQKARKAGVLAPYKKRRICHAEIIRLAKTGKTPKQISEKTGYRYDSVLLSMRGGARSTGHLPPKSRGCRKTFLTNCDIRFGAVGAEVMGKLTDNQWDWLIDNIDQERRLLSDALIKAVVIAAKSNA